LSQAEHDGDAQVMLVSTSAELISAVWAEVVKQLVDLPRQAVARPSIGEARFILTGSRAEAVDIANAYAPEHLSLQIAEPDLILGNIENAGAVFVGAWSAETFGDYVAGPSHVLPTDAAAKTYAGVGVTSFMKSLTIQDVSEAGAQRLAGAAAQLARLEGLEAQARAADCRITKRHRLAEPSVRRRCGEITRETKETTIVARVDLDSAAPVSISTGVGFFDHMLEQVAHHGGFSLTLSCAGDLHIDAHHSIEDCAIAFGQALKEALADRRGIARFGFVLPMDEAEARLSIDLSGRPYLVFDGAFASPALGAYPTEMTKHIFRSLAENLGATIHVAVTGENDHHKTEACFKALGRALRTAIRVESDVLPSTKGVL
jgi:histidinol dehydrogenase